MEALGPMHWDSCCFQFLSVPILGIQTVFSLESGKSSLPDMRITWSLTRDGHGSPLES